jgi:radical SAM superfamily enzyme YgiQ (UPF0313 family)
MKNLYLFELSDVFANQVYLPYSTGVVWAYAQKDDVVKANYKLKNWFYYRDSVEKIIDQIEDPDVIGFSCFMWNWELNCQIVKIVKDKYPKCLIVFGGQHQPLADRHTGFFQRYPNVDVLVHGEGEKTFVKVLKANLDDSPSFNDILGITLNANGTEFITPSRPRMKDIDVSPSPYLDGLYDDIIKKSKFNLNAIVESARGCPFSCSFCEIGESYYSKVNKRYEETTKEVLWLAKNKVEYITDANSNYGLYDDLDLELANTVKSIKEEFGYPHAYRVTWAKGRADRILHIAKVFEEANAQKGMTIALQSMNKEVLKNIARKNVDGGKLESFIEMYEGEGISSYVELIHGLPGETVESFIDGVCAIIELGYHNYLDIHLNMILPNSPMGHPDYMEKYEIKTNKTQPRFSHRHIKEGEELVSDTVNFATASKSMSKQDWIKGHHFRWLVVFGHYLGPLQYIARGLHDFYNISYKDFYTRLLEFAELNQETFIGNEYQNIDKNLSLILENKRHWGDIIEEISDINWEVDEATCIRLVGKKDIFYKEIRSFVIDNFDVDPGVLDELISYQRLALHSPKENYPVHKTLNYNIYESLQNHAPPKPVQEKLKFDGPSYNGDVFSWAKEILWFGRRIASYKTKVLKL